jgi:outer membrane protein TolC
VRAGAALPGDTAAILAELLSALERQRAFDAEREAWLSVLARLSGGEIDERAVLELPVLTGEVARVRAAMAADGRAGMLAHPQFAAYAAQREQLARQADAVQAQSRPQSSAFGRLAFGRPGYEQFTDELHDYWIGGIRVRWAPLDWGRTRREREALDVQREIIDTQEAAFAERLARESEQPLAAMDRLRTTLETDDRIIELRAQVVRQARAQFAERAITAASYVDALTDLEQARVARALHRVQLAQAEAAYLTMLGIELP